MGFRKVGIEAVWLVPWTKDCLTVVAQEPQVATTDWAFAVWCPGGGVVTWGDPRYGGDSRRVQDRLVNVKDICSTEGAFAAIIDGGTVVTWGHPFFGGDSSVVQHHLTDVEVVVLPTPPLVRNELPVIKPSPNAHFVVTMKLALITWFGSVMQDITLFHGIYLANLNAP